MHQTIAVLNILLCIHFHHNRCRIFWVFRWWTTRQQTHLRISHCLRNHRSRVTHNVTLHRLTILSVNIYVKIVDEYSSNNARMMFPMNFNLPPQQQYQQVYQPQQYSNNYQYQNMYYPQQNNEDNNNQQYRG